MFRLVALCPAAVPVVDFERVIQFSLSMEQVLFCFPSCGNVTKAEFTADPGLFPSAGGPKSRPLSFEHSNSCFCDLLGEPSVVNCRAAHLPVPRLGDSRAAGLAALPVSESRNLKFRPAITSSKSRLRLPACGQKHCPECLRLGSGGPGKRESSRRVITAAAVLRRRVRLSGFSLRLGVGVSQ